MPHAHKSSAQNGCHLVCCCVCAGVSEPAGDVVWAKLGAWCVHTAAGEGDSGSPSRACAPGWHTHTALGVGRVCVRMCLTSPACCRPLMSAVALSQVLVSLQSMVFVPDPFYNEPGYERTASTASGKANAAEYNAGVRLGTASHAILAQLRHPDPVFGEAIKVHYSHQGARVAALLQQWAGEAHGSARTQLQQVVTQVQQELGKLPAPPPVAAPQQQQEQDRGAGRGEGGSRGSRQQQTPAAADVDVVDLT